MNTFTCAQHHYDDETRQHGCPDCYAEWLKAEPSRPTTGWQPVAEDDLTEAEVFLNTHSGNFFPKDAYTLRNYTMHMIREVRAKRAAMATVHKTLTEANESGLITDTIWLTGGSPETLFDFVERHTNVTIHRGTV